MRARIPLRPSTLGRPRRCAQVRPPGGPPPTPRPMARGGPARQPPPPPSPLQHPRESGPGGESVARAQGPRSCATAQAGEREEAPAAAAACRRPRERGRGCEVKPSPAGGEVSVQYPPPRPPRPSFSCSVHPASRPHTESQSRHRFLCNLGFTGCGASGSAEDVQFGPLLKHFSHRIGPFKHCRLVSFTSASGSFQSC